MIKKNKFLTGIIALAMVVTMCMPMQKAEAADSELPTADNITFDTARHLTFNTSIAEEVTEADSIRYYKFSLDEAGVVNIGGTQNERYSYFYIYDANKTEIYNDDSDDERSFTLKSCYLTGGDYYLKISHACTDTVNFRVTTDSLGESFTETQDSDNNSVANAHVR